MQDTGYDTPRVLGLVLSYVETLTRLGRLDEARTIVERARPIMESTRADLPDYFAKWRELGEKLPAK